MSDENLQQLLGQVHEKLRNAPSLDPQARSLLRTVMRDIEEALARAGAPAAAATPATPRLEALAVRFETDHPAIAEALRDLVDALGKAGI